MNDVKIKTREQAFNMLFQLNSDLVERDSVEVCRGSLLHKAIEFLIEEEYRRQNDEGSGEDCGAGTLRADLAEMRMLWACRGREHRERAETHINDAHDVSVTLLGAYEMGIADGYQNALDDTRRLI